MDGNLPRTANELEQKFHQRAEDNGATLDHQLSDVPYTNAVFKLGGKSRASGTHPYFETMRQTINIMNVDEQAELAEHWENRFTSSLQFITYLTTDKKELAFWKEWGVAYED